MNRVPKFSHGEKIFIILNMNIINRKVKKSISLHQKDMTQWMIIGFTIINQ